MDNCVALTTAATSETRSSGPRKASPARTFSINAVPAPTTLTLPLVTLTVPVLYKGIGESPERRSDGIGRSRRQTRSHDAGHERRHRTFGRTVGCSREHGILCARSRGAGEIVLNATDPRLCGR